MCLCQGTTNWSNEKAHTHDPSCMLTQVILTQQPALFDRAVKKLFSEGDSRGGGERGPVRLGCGQAGARGLGLAVLLGQA